MTPCANAEETEQRVRDLSEHRLAREPGVRYRWPGHAHLEQVEEWHEPDYTKVSRHAQEKYEESVRW